ncbi:MAG: maturation protein [Sanya fiers-like virus 45]|nr:MAG: maturation protein [Sanya fiers-like virus 45]
MIKTKGEIAFTGFSQFPQTDYMTRRWSENAPLSEMYDSWMSQGLEHEVAKHTAFLLALGDLYDPEHPPQASSAVRAPVLEYNTIRYGVLPPDRPWNIAHWSLKYCWLQDSVNSSVPISDKDLETVELRKINPRVLSRRPKPPVFHPFKGKEPMKPLYPRVFTESELKPIVRPQGRSARGLNRWIAIRLPRIVEKRSDVVARINAQRLATWQRRVKDWERRHSIWSAKVELKKAHYKRALEKYQRKLDQWNEQVKRSKRSVILKEKKHGFSEDHPYRFCHLYLTKENKDTSTREVHKRRADGAVGWIPRPEEPWYPQLEPAHNWVVNDPKYIRLSDSQALSGPSDVAVSCEVLYCSAQFLADAFCKEYDHLLIRKIYQKIMNQQVHIGNLLAERHQTLELLTTNWRRLKDLILLKKSFFKSVGKALMSPRAWANEVLAFKFGVQPLINDIQQACQVLQNGLGEPELVVRTNVTRNVNLSSGGNSFSGKAVISYVIKYNIENELAKRLNEFGLLDPSQIAWEVTPWSFVIDWFLPVGEWLQSLTATTGLKYKTGTKKVKLVGTFDLASNGTPSSDIIPNNGDAVLSCGGGRYVGTWIHRTVLDDWPDRNQILNVKSPFSWSHGIEAIALGIQQIKSIR